MKKADQDTQALTPSQVAHRFGVDPKTVTRWARDGKLASFRTPGGHRRYLATDVEELWQESHKPKTHPELLEHAPSMAEINRLLAQELGLLTSQETPAA